MKVLLQINAIVNIGSTGRIAEGIGKLAIDQGWKSYIAYGRKAQKSSSVLIRVGNKFSIGWHGMLTRLWDMHGFSSSRATRQLIKEIQRISPDIIHLHNLHGYYLNVKLLFDFLSKANIPVVWTLHDCWAMTGHCAHFQNNSCDKWQVGCERCQYLQTYPASWGWDGSKHNFLRKSACFTSIENMTIVPVCRWLEMLVKKSYLRIYPVSTILNGIDIQKFSQVEAWKLKDRLGLNGKFVMLAVASQWNTTKGYGDLLSLSHVLQKDEMILLIGLDAGRIKKLPPGMIALQRTENISDLAVCYSMADVFINPTYEDTFPTVNLEALACGTPVITYDTGGCSETIDETCGKVVKRGDWVGLYEAVSLLRQRGKTSFTQSCRKRVEEYFDEKRQYQSYINLYQSILNR